MTTRDLLTQASAEELTLSLVDDQIIAHGPRPLLAQWAPLLREHKADLMAYLRTLPTPANDPQAPTPDLPSAAFTYAQPQDDRITCTACRNLAPSGRCLAASKLEGMAREHQPDPARLHACYGFVPLASGSDQRDGAKRWPSLAWRARP
ncbi:MAG: hypothetical protein WAT36_06555 [Chromatiaceae bacterium]